MPSNKRRFKAQAKGQLPLSHGQQSERHELERAMAEARTGEGSESALARLKTIERDRQQAELVR